MEHEVGHTIGLRHNFSGSYDAMNFHDDFWRAQGRAQGCVDQHPQRQRANAQPGASGAQHQPE